jgi:inositol monophosphatase 3
VFGLVDYGLIDAKGNKLKIPSESQTSPIIIVSRSHAGEVKNLARRAFGDKYNIEPAGGSGYKTLRILNGTASIYLHTTAIKKWDVCAADALIRAASGNVGLIDLQGQELDYSPETEVLNKHGLLISLHSPFNLLSKFKTVLNK